MIGHDHVGASGVRERSPGVEAPEAIEAQRRDANQTEGAAGGIATRIERGRDRINQGDDRRAEYHDESSHRPGPPVLQRSHEPHRRAQRAGASSGALNGAATSADIPSDPCIRTVMVVGIKQSGGGSMGYGVGDTRYADGVVSLCAANRVRRATMAERPDSRAPSPMSCISSRTKSDGSASVTDGG